MNAISFLQEHVVNSFTHLPKYEIVNVNSGAAIKFTCTCTCGSLKTSATSTSKKDAKHKAAAAMVETMGLTSKLKTAITPIDNTVIEGVCCSNTILINAVGELNEFCSQNELSYPTYNLINQVFTIQCVLKSLVTTGQAINKKQAKQNAAIEMLKLIKQDPSRCKSRQQMTKASADPIQADVLDITGIPDDEVVHLYEKLSFEEKSKVMQKQNTAFVPRQETIETHCKTKEDTLQTDDILIETLEGKLEKFGVKYEIIKISSCDPLTLVFRSYNCNKTGTPTTEVTSLIAMGETRVEATKKLLINALDVIEL